MADDESRDPEQELREFIRRFLAGEGDLDTQALARAAGLPADPQALQALLAQLQQAMNRPGDGIDAELAGNQAKAAASALNREVTGDEKRVFGDAFPVAELWLSEATAMGETGFLPRLLTRTEWIGLTMPVWTGFSDPVAESIATTLTEVIRDQTPEEFSGMLAGAGGMMRNLGSAMFAMQLGQVVGQLSAEVVSGGDIGVPMLAQGQPALIPQNVAAFGEGLGIDEHEVRLYLAVRELAHARLFRHAKWLPLQLHSSITEYAQGISIDVERMTEIAERFDPQNPDELREALSGGQLIPPRTEQQQAALARIETMLALIEGWVIAVTQQATTLLPSAVAIAETVQRRRAAGGPAESAFGTLIGLELRPRRLREAASLWSALTEAVGIEERDRLWSHPDLMPTADDIDHPDALIARLRAGDPEPDDVDRALEDLLNEEEGKA